MSEHTEIECLTPSVFHRALFSRIIGAALLLSLVYFVGTTQTARAQAVRANDAVVEAADSGATTFLVHFTPQSTADERNAILQELGVEVVSWLPQIDVAEVRSLSSGLDRQGNGDASIGAAQVWARMNAVVATTDTVLTIEENMAVTGVDLPNDPALT
ncbi:MAG: hypothetical protein KDE53_28925, partial [Caldilineaceae bacterium]|nr:hypothetical protein [Caldilineaceae bacterium]